MLKPLNIQDDIVGQAMRRTLKELKCNSSVASGILLFGETPEVRQTVYCESFAKENRPYYELELIRACLHLLLRVVLVI